MDDDGIRSKADILANLDSGAEQLLDARGAERFEGATPEPRADVEAGHIPGSLNLPHSAMFNDDGTWKQGDALRAAFVDAGVDLNKPAGDELWVGYDSRCSAVWPQTARQR